MAIGIIHLSDLHLHKTDSGMPLLASRIVKAIWGADQSITSVLVLITGDIAFSGIAEEYAIASKFIEVLKQEVCKIKSISSSEIFVAPGNHDCNFSGVGAIRAIALKSIRDGATVDESISGAISEVQRNFVEFMSNVNNADFQTLNSKYVSSYSLPFETRIKVNIVNTAISSELNEKKGTLVYPLEELILKNEGEDLIVTCFHHPYSWLAEEYSKKFKVTVEVNSDIILTGHEHDFDGYSVSNVAGYNAEYVEGQILGASDKQDGSGFNYIVINMFNAEYTIHKFIQKGNSYSHSGKFSKSFVRNKAIKRRCLEYSAEVEKFLFDPGANFLHPAKRDGLCLEDIFVYPELTINSFDRSSVDKEKSIGPKQIENFIIDRDCLIVSGPEKCGKTTLLKKINTVLHREGFAPTHIDCCSISNSKAINCYKRFQDAFTEQYLNSSYDDFTQLEQSSRVLLLDNFHKLACNARERCALLGIVSSFYGKIIITCDEVFDVTELSYEDGVINPLLGYTRTTIKPFGKYLKEQLIEKWLILDKEGFKTNEELASALYNISEVVDTLFGTKLIPYYPLFILIITQQIHCSRNIENANGSHGEMYEMLIKQSISESHRRIDPITQMNYLSRFAFTLFSTKSRALTETEFKSFHLQYSSLYKETFGFETIVDELLASSIVIVQAGMYAFRYNYSYYYFTAKHISMHFSQDTKLQELVRHMTKHVYIDEYTQLLIFLSYLSDHKTSIIEDIMLTANNVYASLRPCNFESDVAFLNKLGQLKLEVECGEFDGRESRQLALQAMDTIDDNNDGITEENALCGLQERSEVEFIDEVLQMTVSLRCIDILGQILKNFSGTLEGNLRSSITRCCYQLGLRSITFYMNIFSENVQSMWSDLNVRLTELEPNISSEQVSIKAHQFVFFANLYTSYALIQKVASSIGLQKLELTYEDLLKENPSVALSIMDVAVKVESFTDFPEKDIFKLYERLDKNFFAQILTKLMVVKRFEMKQHYREIFRRVCQRLGIVFNKTTAVLMIKQKKIHQG